LPLALIGLLYMRNVAFVEEQGTPRLWIIQLRSPLAPCPYLPFLHAKRSIRWRARDPEPPM
jgi:hypothetical protein